MPRAVRFEQYGGVEVLELAEVDPPDFGDGQLLIRVKAAGINPFEAKLRRGLMQADIPLSFPAAQGTDLAGVVEQIGPDVTDFALGDEILGTTSKRGSQAELAVVSQARVLPRPEALPWPVAGGLWTVGTTAYGAVSAVAPGPGDVVVVAGAAGGVGGLAAQLARQREATAIGVASERSHEWLRSRGVLPVAQGDGLAERLQSTAAGAGGKLTALIDTVGQGYVALAIALGIAPERIDTIVDFEAGPRYGVQTEGGGSVSTVEVVEELVQLIVDGEVELPIARTFPLDQVRDAYTLLETGHPPGKIVLIP
ncbi:MAG TPA: NADP-dependent oxidoreductase [Solirubrobacteraceae bacterium]|jgi:NADPH:quinone reductase-like Zn-dependent oxidoreductase|nr:NADP-dependent oxidoreductase [Solirubrobacteraceae bacterium]